MPCPEGELDNEAVKHPVIEAETSALEDTLDEMDDVAVDVDDTVDESEIMTDTEAVAVALSSGDTEAATDALGGAIVIDAKAVADSPTVTELTIVGVKKAVADTDEYKDSEEDEDDVKDGDGDAEGSAEFDSNAEGETLGDGLDDVDEKADPENEDVGELDPVLLSEAFGEDDECADDDPGAD